MIPRLRIGVILTDVSLSQELQQIRDSLVFFDLSDMFTQYLNTNTRLSRQSIGFKEDLKYVRQDSLRDEFERRWPKLSRTR